MTDIARKRTFTQITKDEVVKPAKLDKAIKKQKKQEQPAKKEEHGEAAPANDEKD
jgi:hypothetical protein